jgi:hypothetical protein
MNLVAGRCLLVLGLISCAGRTAELDKPGKPSDKVLLGRWGWGATKSRTDIMLTATSEAVRLELRDECVSIRSSQAIELTKDGSFAFRGSYMLSGPIPDNRPQGGTTEVRGRLQGDSVKVTFRVPSYYPENAKNLTLTLHSGADSVFRIVC